jgi:hypothetical protein
MGKQNREQPVVVAKALSLVSVFNLGTTNRGYKVFTNNFAVFRQALAR